MSDYNPTDDELRAIADHADHHPDSTAYAAMSNLARLVLREREEHRRLYEQDDSGWVADRAEMYRERDQARAALSRVEALGNDPLFRTLLGAYWLPRFRAAITGEAADG